MKVNLFNCDYQEFRCDTYLPKLHFGRKAYIPIGGKLVAVKPLRVTGSGRSAVLYCEMAGKGACSGWN